MKVVLILDFPLYFQEDMSSGFEETHLIHAKILLRWFAQPEYKRQHLSKSSYYLGKMLGFIFDLVGNINHYFTSRLLCYWIGGYDEIKFVFIKK